MQQSQKYFSCGSEDEIEDFLLRIRFVVNQPNHSKSDDIIKKEIGNVYKISGEEDIDTVFVRVYDKVEKWWAQQGSKVSYLTRKDDYFREVIEHLYSLKPREDRSKMTITHNALTTFYEKRENFTLITFIHNIIFSG